MAQPKRKLTTAEKAEKKKRRERFMTIFINGRQKRVQRPPTIEGMDPDEFIRRNADPIWLHQNERWELMDPDSNDEVFKPLSVPFPRDRSLPSSLSTCAARVIVYWRI